MKELIPDRDPDIETEKYKSWRLTDSEIKDDTVKGIEIDINGTKIELVGFSSVKDKNGLLMFAWKLKKNNFIYYLSDESWNPGGVIKNLLSEMEKCGNVLKNVRDMMQEIDDIADTLDREEKLNASE